MEEFVKLCLVRWLKCLEKYARQYVIDYVIELFSYDVQYYRVIVIGVYRMEMNWFELTRSHVDNFKWYRDDGVVRLVGSFSVKDDTKEEIEKNVKRKNASDLERKNRIAWWRDHGMNNRRNKNG